MISVIIATHNGARTLPRMLSALRDVAPPRGGVEWIAIDNASTDGTAGVLADAGLGIRILSEPRRGKSFALNRGLSAANGDLIVFADDDVLPSPDWLRAYEDVAGRRPDCGVFAGQIRHAWDRTPPRWLEALAAAGQSFAGTPVGQPEGPLDPWQAKGANMMVRRDALGTVRFRESERINFTGQASSAGGEDTLFVADLVAQGCRAWFVPDASLRHIVRAEQVGLRPVFRRYFRIGRAQAAGDPLCFNPNGRILFGYPGSAFRMVARSGARGLAALARGRSAEAAREMIEVAMTAGRAQEWRRANRSRPATTDRPSTAQGEGR